MHREWSHQKFGACVSLCRNGIAYTNKEDTGGLPISRIQTISEGKINLSKVGFSGLKLNQFGSHMLEAGDILFSHINSLAHVGKVALVEKKYLPLVHGMNLLRIKPSKLLTAEFLFLVLQSAEFRTEVVSRAQVAVNQVSINISSLKEIEVFVPPVNVQVRIVDVVSSVDAYIDALQQQADTARTARNAALHELLSTGGDDWTETTLGDIAHWSSGKNLSSDKRHETGLIPILGANGIIGRTNEVLLDEELITVGRVGACGETHRSSGPVWISDNALIVIPTEQVTIDLLFYVLSTFNYQSIISGTTQPLITQSKMKSQVVNLPPLDEQKRIVEIVSSMDDVIQTTEQAVTDAKNLRSGLLSDLLSGEHEIPASYDSLLGAA